MNNKWEGCSECCRGKTGSGYGYCAWIREDLGCRDLDVRLCWHPVGTILVVKERDE